MSKYNPKDIEPKWQKYWEDNKIFQTPNDVNQDNKMYILPQLPYPSGSGLHVGHAEGFTACDIYARYLRMTGKKVLQVMGWDAFGLPAENYAIKTNVHPRKSTNDAINNFRRQLKELGISVDWDREVGSHNPDYYQWTQWFFLLMYERGLAYRKKQSVNWCESCKTVLANEQVTTDGKCERCDTVVVQRDMEQWYLKITDYADKLLEGLDRIDWPEETKKRQRDWIGRSEGALVQFSIVNSQSSIEVFTTRPDTIFGATYLVLAPEHPFVVQSQEFIANSEEVRQYVEATKLKTELDRQTQAEKTGVELKGVKAINPATGEEIPVWVADYVLSGYGTAAIMAVPAHDERDFEFAMKKIKDGFIIKVIPVIDPELNQNLHSFDFKSYLGPYGYHIQENESQDDFEVRSLKNELSLYYEGKRCYSLDGKLINSDFLNGLTATEAKEKIISWLEEKGIGKRKVQYKLRDWSVSRQRFWGAPIPMVYDPEGNIHPVKPDDLPVLLPDDVDFKPTGQSPLTYSPSFQQGVEEKYGKGWHREVDTLDTFMCSSWYYYRYLDPKNDQAFASPESLKTWMPVDFYLGGAEHVNGHLLYSRFFTKVLYDAGYIDFDEPFMKHRHQGLILGEDNRKMSKRWGNVINPTDVVNEYGADTMRTYEMFMGPLEQTKPWDTNGVRGVRRFLERVYKLSENIADRDETSAMTTLLHQTIKKVTEDVTAMRFNTAVAKMMETLNEFAKQETIARSTYRTFILLLSPFAPHMTEELWSEVFGETTSIAFAPWPTYDPALTVSDMMTIVVQVNGKLRDSIDMSSDVSEEEAKKTALASEKVQKYLEGKEPKKVIYVKGKLVSIVV